MATPRPTTPTLLAALAVLTLTMSGSLAGCGETGRRGAGSPASPPNATRDGSGPIPIEQQGGQAACRVGNLTLSAGLAQQAMQHFGRIVLVRLRGTRACTLSGYPGVQLVSATGRPLPTSTRRDGSYLFPTVPPRPVALAPGGVASFALGGPAADAAGSASCPLAAAVRIIPPGDVGAVRVPMTLPDCGTIDVSPVVPGRTGPSRS